MMARRVSLAARSPGGREQGHKGDEFGSLYHIRKVYSGYCVNLIMTLKIAFEQCRRGKCERHQDMPKLQYDSSTSLSYIALIFSLYFPKWSGWSTQKVSTRLKSPAKDARLCP